ncbi:MAG: hypothetical protein OHK0022_30580 [Roseiflexaceae bacterium]
MLRPIASPRPFALSDLRVALDPNALQGGYQLSLGWRATGPATYTLLGGSLPDQPTVALPVQPTLGATLQDGVQLHELITPLPADLTWLRLRAQPAQPGAGAVLSAVATIGALPTVAAHPEAANTGRPGGAPAEPSHDHHGHAHAAPAMGGTSAAPAKPAQAHSHQEQAAAPESVQILAAPNPQLEVGSPQLYCPVGSEADQSLRDPRSGCEQPSAAAGDPVDLLDGSWYSTIPCLILGGAGLPIIVSLRYDTHKWADGIGASSIGTGWTVGYSRRLRTTNSWSTATLTLEDGSWWQFSHSGNGVYTSGAGNFTRLTRDLTTGVLTLTYRNGMQDVFDSTGRLVRMQDRLGNQTLISDFVVGADNIGRITLTNNRTGQAIVLEHQEQTAAGVTAWKLVRILDAAQNGSPQRQITLTYGTTGMDAGRLVQVVDAGGRVFTYGYDNRGRVASYFDPLRNPSAVTNALPTTIVYNQRGENSYFGTDHGVYDEMRVRQLLPPGTSTATFRDDFSVATLAAGWSWVRENPATWSLSARPGFLRRTTEAGDIAGTATNSTNILLRTPSTADFLLSTRLEATPAANTHSAGLIVYTDDNNWVRLAPTYSFGSVLEFVAEVNGTTTRRSIPLAQTPLFLQLRKQGTTYVAAWSSNGVRWQTAGSFTGVALAAPRVGLFAHNGAGSTAAAIPVDFDWFEVRSLQTTLPTVDIQSSYTSGTWQIFDRTVTYNLGQTSAISHSIRLQQLFGTQWRMTRSYLPGSLTRFTTYDYTSGGLLRMVTDPLGYRTETVYDSVTGDVREVRVYTNAPTNSTFDLVQVRTNSFGQTTNMTDTLGYGTAWTYNGDGTLRQVDVLHRTDPAQRQTTRLDYDPLVFAGSATAVNAGLPTRVTLPDGTLITQSYDTRGYPATTTYDADRTGYTGLKITESTTHDWRGYLTAWTDRQGVRTVYEYTQNPAAGQYGAQGWPSAQVVDQTAANTGRRVRTTMAYDAMGNLTQLVADQGGQNATWQYQYTLVGPLARYLPSRVTDALGQVTDFAYTVDGQLATITERNVDNNTATADDRTTRYAYTRERWLDTVTTHDNRVVANYDYNDAGQVTRFVDGAGATTTYAYDGKGRLQTETRGTVAVGTAPAVNAAYTYSYDAADNIIRVDGPNSWNAQWNYTSDPYGRLAWQRNGVGNQTTYLYDDTTTRRNWLTRVIQGDNVDAEQLVTDYQYDPLGRLRSQIVDPGTGRRNLTTQYAYTLAGSTDRWHLQRVTEPNGNATSYRYNTLGLLDLVTDALGGSWSYAYTNLGHLTTVTPPAGSAPTTYVPDVLGQVRSLTRNGQTESWTYRTDGTRKTYTDFSGQVVNYGYDPAGRLTGMDYAGTASDPGGARSDATFSYYGNDQLRTATSNPNGTTAETTTYSYDALNRFWKRDRGGRVVTYGYNANSSLVSLDYWGQGSVTYTHDAAGRIQSMNPWSTGASSYTYRATNLLNTAQRPNVAPALNNVLTSYGYDGASRLTSVGHTRAGISLETVSYQLDANSNRTQMTDSTGTTQYLYDQLNRLGEANTPALAASGTSPAVAAQRQQTRYDRVGNRLSGGSALAGRWQLEGQALDNSGNGNNGTITGAVATPGRVGQALLFDGVDDTVQVPHSASLAVGQNGADFSVGFWVRLDQTATGAWRALVHKGAADTQRTFAIWMNPSTNQLHYRISTTSNWNSGGDSIGALAVGTWTHVGYVKRGNTLELYLNGVLDSSVALAGTVVGNSGPLYIGKDPWYSGLGGALDELVVVQRAWTSGEVAALATALPTGARWLLDAAATDTSGNGNTGTISGAVFTPGKINQALLFDGVDDTVQVPHSASLAAGQNGADFSVSFWLRVDQGPNGGWRTLMHKGAANTDRTFALWLTPTSTQIYYAISTTANWNAGGYSTASLPLNTWTHVAYVKRGATLELYLNGTLDSSVPLPGTVVGNTGPLYIGKDPWHGGLRGALDEVQVVQRALSTAEVATLAVALDQALGYDASDRITGNSRYTYDANGNLLTDAEGTTYTYDAANRLIRTVKDGVATDYQYDALGNLVRQIRAGTTTDYVLDEMGLATVLGEVRSGADTTTTLYAYGPDGLHAKRQGTAVSYGHSDGLGNLRAWSGAADGAVQQRLHYNAWGVLRQVTGAVPSSGVGPGFTGEWQRPDGTVHLRARAYNPSLGRFLQRDTFAGFATRPQSLNRYAYAENNPANWTDPTGHAVETALDIASATLSIADAIRAFRNNDCDRWWALGAAALDVGSVFLPFIPAVGMVRHANKLDDISQFASHLKGRNVPKALRDKVKVRRIDPASSDIPQSADKLGNGKLFNLPARTAGGDQVYIRTNRHVLRTRIPTTDGHKASKLEWSGYYDRPDLLEQRRNLPNPRNMDPYVHTEPKALDIARNKPNVDHSKPIEMESLVGEPPCNSCQSKVRQYTQETGQEVRYRWTNETGTHEWSSLD